jgi:hypothetical protein
VYKVLVGKAIRKRPPGHRWEDNIKIDLREVGWEGTDWLDVVRDRDWWRVLVNAVINFRVL